MVDDPAFAGRGYAKIPHAKSAKDAEGVIFNFGFLMFDYRRVRMWESGKV